MTPLRSIGSLCDVVPLRWGRFILLLAALSLLPWPPGFGHNARAESQSSPSPIVSVSIQNAITRSTAEYLKQAMDHAAARRAPLLLIALDTPGGLLDATRTIVRHLLDAPLPVVVYVSPAGARAGSAGLFITLAAHFAVMAPGSNIGAAHPVSGFGADVPGDMGDKVTNDAAAWARSLAETRGRNPAWAEKAVTESAALTAGEAAKQEVIDFVARDVSALLATLDGKSVVVRGKPRTLHTTQLPVEAFERDTTQQVYDWLADPNLLYLLFLLGLAGLFIEFQSPGLIVPGALGIICLGLVFGMQALPINGLGVALILASVALLVLEVYVTSFGLLTIAAMTCLVLGSYMLYSVPGSSVKLNPWLIWSVAAVMTTVLAAIGTMIARAKLQGPTSGADTLVGHEAVVAQTIVPDGEGKIFLDGSHWNARAEQRVEQGTKVRVERFEGLVAYVTPYPAQHTDQA